MSEPYRHALRLLKQGRTWQEVADLIDHEVSADVLEQIEGERRGASCERKYAIMAAAWDEVEDRDRRAHNGLNYAMQAVQRAREGGLTDQRAKEVMGGLKNFADTMLCDN
jgi:hypothetical protein